MWLIALSYAALGVNAFALRLPSLLLSGGALIFTYLIGAELFDRRIGLIAAFWQAFNACTYRLIHGYLFSDHVDIALLFWVEVSCYLLIRGLRTGRSRYYMLCGVAQGLAYLSKSYLGFLALVISAIMWLLVRLRAFPPRTCRIGFRHLPMQLATALLVVAPWAIYCLVEYPREFLYEHRRVLDHLNSDVESWGATWDRHLFDYMLLVVPIVYSATLASAILLMGNSMRKRSWQDAFVLIWMLGVVVPLSLAETKTPSATLIGMPALLLGLSVVIGRSLSDIRYAVFWLAMGLASLTFPGGWSNVKGRDEFDGIDAVAPYLMANLWIVVRVLGMLGIGVMLLLIGRFLIKRRDRILCHRAMLFIALALTIVLGVRSVQESKEVTDINADDPTYQRLGQAINRQFPKNSCFFLEGAPTGAHQRLMFYADRTVYDLGNRDLQADAIKVKANGGIPYLITRTERDAPLALDHGQQTGYRIYALTDP
jgi:4-amino-4-deoxy-L-arabinose transferase-like glycosyltransferase